MCIVNESFNFEIIEFLTARMVDDYEFNNYSVSKIDYFPYVNFSEDRILDEIDTKVGAEIFWKYVFRAIRSPKNK